MNLKLKIQTVIDKLECKFRSMNIKIKAAIITAVMVTCALAFAGAMSLLYSYSMLLPVIVAWTACWIVYCLYLMVLGELQ